MTTLEKVKDIIGEKLDVCLCDIHPETLIVEELGANSLEKVEIIITFEEEFKIVIHDADAMRIRTIQDAADAIDARVALLSEDDALSL